MEVKEGHVKLGSKETIVPEGMGGGKTEGKGKGWACSWEGERQ